MGTTVFSCAPAPHWQRQEVERRLVAALGPAHAPLQARSLRLCSSRAGEEQDSQYSSSWDCWERLSVEGVEGEVKQRSEDGAALVACQHRGGGVMASPAAFSLSSF